MTTRTIDLAVRPADRTLRRERSRSLGRRIAGLVPFALVLLLAVIGPLLGTHDPTIVAGTGSTAPSGSNWFGTDSNGLDVYSRTMAAFQLDIALAVAITLLATAGGLVAGLLIGMYEARRTLGGFLARLGGRAIDLVQSIPVMIAGMVVAVFFGRTAAVIAIALAIVITPFQARLMRTEVLAVRTAGFVDAARMSGESEIRVLLSHVLPNAWRSTLENMSTVFAMGIIFSAALGFLGAGIPLPVAEWGSMLALGAPDAAVGRWWAVLFPALALGFSVWAASMAVTALTASDSRPRRSTAPPRHADGARSHGKKNPNGDQQ